MEPLSWSHSENMTTFPLPLTLDSSPPPTPPALLFPDPASLPSSPTAPPPGLLIPPPSLRTAFCTPPVTKLSHFRHQLPEESWPKPHRSPVSIWSREDSLFRGEMGGGAAVCQLSRPTRGALRLEGGGGGDGTQGGPAVKAPKHVFLI